MPRALLLLSALLAASAAPAQIAEALRQPLHSPDAATVELRTYLLDKAPRLDPPPASAAQWTARARDLRRRILDDIVFHGWPPGWVSAPPRFEDAGLVPAGPGYRMRKLRYEIVPGFWSTAILYEPERLNGKVPAILNVNGHGAEGKALEYKQKRCINQALQGILSLNLEWPGFGELSGREYNHSRGAYLDLVGANDAGFFYLAMRKGLDYLAAHPAVDPARLGVTGLSGGGWQTITLSALDERVAVAVPVAGYAAVISRLERPGDIGDLEQNPTDFLTLADYSHLTAMRAPRPTLLVYNAEDDCCFRAALVKPYIFDSIVPFFRLYDRSEALAFHENRDPGTHNYQLDNRLASYGFFTRHFGLPPADREVPVDAQVRTRDELTVGLPQDNLTILGLARKLAESIRRPPLPAGGAARDAERHEFARTLRYQPVRVRHAWAMATTKNRGVETRGYRFEFDNGLSATGVWLKAIPTPEKAPATIILASEGKKTAETLVADRLPRGEQVLAVDLLLTGDAAPVQPPASLFTLLIGAMGRRPLGFQAAQLAGIASWASTTLGAPSVRLETTGIRAQAVALSTAALNPGIASEIVVRGGMASFGHLLDAPVEYAAAPELFCLDLYRTTDLDRLAALAAPARILNRSE